MPRWGSVERMATIWTRTAEGNLINNDGVLKWRVEGNQLKAFHADGSVTGQVFGSGADAQAAFQGIVDALSQVVSDTGVVLDHLTPNTGASGGAVNAVLIGSGFQFDIVTASFIATITIGGTAMTSVTYVDSNTLLLLWTPASAGVKDLIYTAKDGITTTTLTGAFTAS